MQTARGKTHHIQCIPKGITLNLLLKQFCLELLPCSKLLRWILPAPAGTSESSCQVPPGSDPMVVIMYQSHLENRHGQFERDLPGVEGTARSEEKSHWEYQRCLLSKAVIWLYMSAIDGSNRAISFGQGKPGQCAKDREHNGCI